MDNKRMELLAGFSILFIVVSNAVNFWLVPNGQIRYILAFILIILELFGATFYIFLNSLKVSFLLEKRMGCIADKVNRNKVLKQGILLILLGIPFNIIINPIYEFPNNLWGWNIFTFLGFSQILCYVSYKMVRWTRIIIGLIIIFLTAGIRQFLFSLKDFNLVFEIAYFVIVSPYPSYSLLPFTAFCFFSTVFGELLYEARILKSRVAELNAIKSILKYGIVLLCIGLIIPIMEFRPILTESNYNPVEYPFSDMPSILISELVVFVPNLPGFLIKGTPSNIFISMGISLILISIAFHHFYYKQNEGRISNKLLIFGNYSITLLFLQYLFLYAFYQSVSVWLLSFALVIYIVGLGFLIYYWSKYASKFLNIDAILKKLIN